MRCKEFYEKWERCGNFCEKHKDTAERIDKYLSFIEEIENKADIDEKTKQTIVAASEGVLRTLIEEKDEEIKQKAISTLGKSLNYHRPPGSQTEKKITAKNVVEVLSRVRKEVKGKNPLPLPTEGKYRTIVIDPPWEIEKIQREVRPNQIEMDYPTMSV